MAFRGSRPSRIRSIILFSFIADFIAYYYCIFLLRIKLQKKVSDESEKSNTRKLPIAKLSPDIQTKFFSL
jgi:hypothetical protein